MFIYFLLGNWSSHPEIDVDMEESNLSSDREEQSKNTYRDEDADIDESGGDDSESDGGNIEEEKQV